jgi:hypothetical protein
MAHVVHKIGDDEYVIWSTIVDNVIAYVLSREQVLTLQTRDFRPGTARFGREWEAWEREVDRADLLFETNPNQLRERFDFNTKELGWGLTGPNNEPVSSYEELVDLWRSNRGWHFGECSDPVVS